MASGRFQYSWMTLGPLIWISPTVPGSAEPASGSAGSAIRTSVKKCGSPDEPALSRDRAAGSVVAPGAVSVMP